MSYDHFKVLAIEDDSGDAELLRRHLESISTFDTTFIHATTPQAAKDVLSKDTVDVIFLDQMLGADTGMHLLSQLRDSGELRPIIAMTGQGDEYMARDSIRNGADDYLVKGDLAPELLRRSIENAIGGFKRRQLEQINAKLAKDLKQKNESLKLKNRRLAELYDTAHEFVDNVSHEFRTPLTVIKEFTSILYDGLAGDVSAEQQEYLATVLDRVDDLATMVDDMLDISKLEAGLLGIARKVCTVREVFDRVQKTLERKAASNQVHLATNIAELLPSIYCDPEKIGRVIINLAINAIKFSDEGGKVTLWADKDSELDTIRIGISDNGPGIDPDKVSEIFDRFQQAGGEIRSSTKGFGLGLNIARELVRLNFGDIDVSSELGEGSTFSFTVPVYDPQLLIRRYLERIQSFCENAQYVSLFVVKVAATTDTLALEDAERFLQHQIRRSDFVISSPSGGWIVVAASNQAELGALMSRIESARNEANRNRPGSQLPQLTFMMRGNWLIHEDSQEFVEAFESEVNELGLTYA